MNQARQCISSPFTIKRIPPRQPTSKAWDLPDPGTSVNDLAATVSGLSAPSKVTNHNEGHGSQPLRQCNRTSSLDTRSDPLPGNLTNLVLLLADQGNSTYDQEWNVKNFGKKTTTRVVTEYSLPRYALYAFGMTTTCISCTRNRAIGTVLLSPTLTIHSVEMSSC